MPRIVQWERQIGRRLRLSDLFVFFTVVKSGSMTKAAAQLNVATPSISEIIVGLEQSLGVRLLDRSPRGVQVTSYGETLMKYGEAAFDELRQGIKAIEFLADPTTGELRIGCPESIVATILPQIVQEFSKKHPRVIIYVDNVPTPALRNSGLRDRKVDLILARLGRPPLEDLVTDELNVEFLLDDPLVLASGVQNEWARRRKIKLAELVNEPWILTPSNTWEYTWVANAFRSRGLDVPKGSLVTISVPFRVRLLTEGAYITTLALSVARLNGLKVLPVDLLPWEFPVVVATLKNRTLSPVVDHFIACAHEVARGLSGGKRAATKPPESC